MRDRSVTIPNCFLVKKTYTAPTTHKPTKHFTLQVGMAHVLGCTGYNVLGTLRCRTRLVSSLMVRQGTEIIPKVSCLVLSSISKERRALVLRCQPCYGHNCLEEVRCEHQQHGAKSFNVCHGNEGHFDTSSEAVWFAEHLVTIDTRHVLSFQCLGIQALSFTADSRVVNQPSFILRRCHSIVTIFWWVSMNTMLSLLTSLRYI